MLHTPTTPSLTLKRRFNASPAKVFAAWTVPEQLARWFGPGDIGRVEATLDLRTGGTFHICARASDGEEHNVSGSYREVVPDRKLVFTWAWRSTPERESLVTIELRPDGDGTLLTLTHERFFDEAARDRHRGGWNGSLDKLAAYLG